MLDFLAGSIAAAVVYGGIISVIALIGAAASGQSFRCRCRVRRPRYSLALLSYFQASLSCPAGLHLAYPKNEAASVGGLFH